MKLSHTLYTYDKALTITNITVITGVGNKYRKQVVEEIKRVLGELAKR